MIVYLDSSVILRFLLGQPGRIENWGGWEAILTSEMTRVEGFRAVDRLRLLGKIDDDEVRRCVQRLDEVFQETKAIQLDRLILRRAAESFPTVIGTLDAIHIASAVLWQTQFKNEITFLTHDLQQGRAAQALGLKASGFEDG